jgi:N-acetylglucosaminyl-diphospho-decaprenol L-rhamnosyltransferase
MLDLGIVIVNYNVCDLLRDCLKSVYASTDLTFEVCVVDNASADGSANMIAREFPQVHLIRNQDNVGYAAANNLGLKLLGFRDQEISTPQSAFRTPHSELPRYALLLNPDTIVPPDGLARMIGLMDQRSDLGVAGPKLVRLDGSLDLACRRSFPTPEVSFWRMTYLSKIFPHSKLFGRYNMTYLDANQPAEIDAVVGAFMLVRGQAIEQAGLLDESFWMYGEDLDWAYRIKHKGWKVYYYPQVVVQHVKRASSGQDNAGAAKAKYEFDRAMWLFYRKHYQVHTSGFVDRLVRFGIGLKGGSKLRTEMNGKNLAKVVIENSESTSNPSQG